VNWKPRKGAVEVMSKTCYVSLNITHLDIQEKLEDAKAVCVVKFQVRLLWLCEREDYIQYSQTLENQEKYTTSFLPKLKVSARDVKEVTEDKKVRVVNVRDFFGDQLIDQLRDFENIAKGLDGKKVKLLTTFNDEKVSLAILPQHREIIARANNEETLVFTVRAVTSMDTGMEMGVMFEYVEKSTNKDAEGANNTKKGIDWSTKYYLTCDANGSCAKTEKKARSLSQIWKIYRKAGGFEISSMKYPELFLGIKNLDYPINAKCGADQAKLWQLEGDLASLDLKVSVFGYLNVVEYEYECTIDEPFELRNYPFDYQDVPLRIKPENFNEILPAYCNVGNDNKHFVKIAGEAVSLVQNLVTEFWSDHASSEIRVLLKCARNFQPVLINYVFLISGVCALSLTSFAVPDTEVSGRLQIVLGLLLALMFIEIPKTQTVTYMDQYFFVSFFYVVAISIQNAVAPQISFIDNRTWIALFTSFYFVYHLLFILRSYYVAKKEEIKANMSSVAIKKAVSKTENRALGTMASSWTPRTNSQRYKMMRYDAEPLRFKEGLLDLMEDLDNFLDDGTLPKDTDKNAKYWYFVLLALASALPLLASLMQIVVVFNSNCSQSGFAAESVILLFLVVLPLILYPFFWAGKIDDSSTNKCWRWTLVTVGALAVAAQFALAAHSCNIWSHQHICHAGQGAVELLFVLFVCWLVYYVVLMVVGLYMLCKTANDAEEKAIIVMLVFLFLIFFILPLCAASVQVAVLHAGSGCTGSNSVTWAEAVSLLVLVVLSIVGWSSIFPAAYADMSATVGFAACCSILMNFVQFGLSCHSLAYFSDDSTSCSSDSLKSLAYGLFMAWVIVDGLSLLGFCCLCVVAMFQ
ncbi:hypothetical protein RFI_10047, partial [Reticulomyxa filosa]